MRKTVYGFVFCLLIITGINAAGQNIFTNSTLGFSITKPPHWQVTSAEDYFKNLNQVRTENKEFQELAIKYAKVPLFAFMKYPEPYDDINPSIKVHYKYREALPNFAGKNPQQILDFTIETFKQVFKDFKIIEAPTDADLSGIKSAYMKYQYTLTAPDGRGFPNCSEMWVVPRGDYFYLIVVGYRQDASAEDLKDIKQMISSIKIVQ
jgi:hypothetical protein